MFIELEAFTGINLSNNLEFLILQRKDSEKRFALLVEHDVICEISADKHKTPGPRPTAHQAWGDTILSCGVILEKFTIHQLDKDQSLQCSLDLKYGERVWSVACHPIDGIIVALRLGSPILCEEDTFEKLFQLFSLDSPDGSEESDEVKKKLRIFEATHQDIPKA